MLMTVEREACLRSENGLHVRVAAMLVQRAEELGRRLGVRLFLRTERSKLREMGSLMKLIGLKVSSGEKVFVTVEGLSAETPAENLEQAADSMCELLESDFEEQGAERIHQVDSLLHENALMQQRLQMILEAVQDGICVVDSTGVITYRTSTRQPPMATAAAC